MEKRKLEREREKYRGKNIFWRDFHQNNLRSELSIFLIDYFFKIYNLFFYFLLLLRRVAPRTVACACADVCVLLSVGVLMCVRVRMGVRVWVRVSVCSRACGCAVLLSICKIYRFQSDSMFEWRFRAIGETANEQNPDRPKPIQNITEESVAISTGIAKLCGSKDPSLIPTKTPILFFWLPRKSLELLGLPRNYWSPFKLQFTCTCLTNVKWINSHVSTNCDVFSNFDLTMCRSGQLATATADVLLVTLPSIPKSSYTSKTLSLLQALRSF